MAQLWAAAHDWVLHKRGKVLQLGLWPHGMFLVANASCFVVLQVFHMLEESQPEMFHPPKIPQQQRNINRTGFQRVAVENPLNADVAPVVDPFFKPLLAVVGHCWFNGRC